VVTRSALTRFARDQRGATAIEYGLIVALIAVAIITGLNTFANTTNGTYQTIETAIENVL
jgi:pilus assembly protein Flp/PilA